MSATSLNSMHFDISIDTDTYMARDLFDFSFDLTYNGPEDIELVWTCSTGQELKWQKYSSFEAYGMEMCETFPYYVEFVTDSTEPKSFNDLLNNAHMWLEVEFHSSMTYTVGWNLDQ